MKQTLLAILTISLCIGCSSAKPSISKTKQKVARMTTNKPQYAIVNNQIIIFENNY
jgi:uncharacterized protein YcfL